MYITVLQENLTKALQFVSKTIASKPQLPILANVLLQGSGGTLRVSTSNMETTMSALLDVKVETEGDITVPAKPFSDFIASLSPGNVELQLKGNMLKATAGSFSASFVTVSASEYPPLPQKGKKPEFSFNAETFSHILSLVCLSAATDEGRPVLTGVNLAKDGDKVTFAATDGFRLSVVTRDAQLALESLIIPAKTFQEALKLTEKKEESVAVFTTPEKNQIFFVSENREIATRLIEGNFPDYKKIIPDKFSTRVVFEREPMLAAVRTASIFARQSANVVRLHVANDRVTVSANAAQLGENKVVVEASVEGDGGEVAFNARFLLDFLSNFGEDHVVFEMASALNPGVFKSEKDTSFLHIIMPVRVQD